MDIILETKDLTKTYKAGGNHINAVDHTSICVERGDFVTIVGKSGSGKSTLLHLIGGLDYPTSGEVWIDNECITNMNEEDLSAFRRRKIGFIFQAFNLVPSLNVWENIILPIGLDDRKPDMVYLKEIIELLGFAACYLQKALHSLSSEFPVESYLDTSQPYSCSEWLFFPVLPLGIHSGTGRLLFVLSWLFCLQLGFLSENR